MKVPVFASNSEVEIVHNDDHIEYSSRVQCMHSPTKKTFLASTYHLKGWLVLVTAIKNFEELWLKVSERNKMLNLETLENRKEQLCLKFAKSCQKTPKFSDIFPKNEKTHQMGLRNPKVFKVQHANTERFRKSAIIQMQHLLNDDTEKNRLQNAAE